MYGSQLDVPTSPVFDNPRIALKRQAREQSRGTFYSRNCESTIKITRKARIGKACQRREDSFRKSGTFSLTPTKTLGKRGEGLSLLVLYADVYIYI